MTSGEHMICCLNLQTCHIFLAGGPAAPAVGVLPLPPRPLPPPLLLPPPLPLPPPADAARPFLLPLRGVWLNGGGWRRLWLGGACCLIQRFLFDQVLIDFGKPPGEKVDP